MNKIRAIQELNKKEIEQGMYVTCPSLPPPPPLRSIINHLLSNTALVQ